MNDASRRVFLQGSLALAAASAPSLANAATEERKLAARAYDLQLAPTPLPFDPKSLKDFYGSGALQYFYARDPNADPRSITPSLDLLFIAKSIERIGDHAKNLAECVIYIVSGLDARHTPVHDIESQLG